MSGIRSVVVLVHPYQGFDYGYFLRRIALVHWAEEQGRRVIVHQGLENLPEADACILHLDLTELPEDYVAAARRYPIALNTRPRSIAKRQISRALLSADDSYDGPVVVKSDLNHRGLSERRLAEAQGVKLLTLRERVERWWPRPWRRQLDREGYLALPRRSQVPSWVWRDRSLVVERLFVEPVGELFAIRQWFCLGTRGVVSVHLGPEPMVKLANSVRRLRLQFEVPDAIREQRRALGLDFGKLDFVLSEQGPYLFDVNRTPHNGTRIDIARCRWMCRYLSRGLDDYAAGGVPSALSTSAAAGPNPSA